MYTGLFAQYYDRLITVDDDERDFYMYFLRDLPGRALELGCGTGQLLAEYVRQGLLVDGLDSSAVMRAQCAQKVHGFPVVLHEQRIEQLALDVRYTTLYAPAMVLMHIERQQVPEVLRRMYEHLLPGGQVLISLFNPMAERGRMPATWQLYQRLALSEGKELVWWQLLEYDSATRVRTAHYRFELEGVIEEHIVQWYWYSPDELCRLLTQAGFTFCRAFGEYTMMPADVDDEIFVIHAVR